MLVVEPSTLRYEEEAASNSQHNDQLVERVSMLENRLLRFAEKLEKAFELLLQQSQMSLRDHEMLDTLIGLMEETGKVDRAKLKDRRRAAMGGDGDATGGLSRLEFMRANIVEKYEGEDKQVFAELIGEGLQLLQQGKSVRAQRPLERAAALAPGNATLNFIIGLQFFREGKLTLAHAYLQRAYEAEPVSPQVFLLLGVACGDDGEIEQARKLLGEMLDRCGSSFAAHYALGRLLAVEGNWTDALVQFKRSLAAKPCAEAQYVMGFALYQLGRFRAALRHVSKAVELNENYAGAFELLGFIQEQLGDAARARAARATARSLGATIRETRGAKKRPGDLSAETLLHSFFGASRHRGKRLLTGGDKQLAELLREDALAQVGYGTLTPTR